MSEWSTYSSGDVFELGEERLRAAALTVAANARDADECRELLEMLGLKREGDAR